MRCGVLAIVTALTVPLHPSVAQPVIRKPAQPGKFIEAVGRRAALLGREDGTFEAWTFPIKVLRDFRLSAYIDGALEPVPLAALAETVEVHPGFVTITYIHPAFTLRETWVAAIDEPVLALHLEVDTSRPLRLRASFTPEMKPMWPASFGGQSTSWDADAKVLSFTEGLRRFRPVLGSPAFTRISEQIGHQLPDRTVTIEMEIQKSGAMPVVIAASRALYDSHVNAVPALIDAAEKRDREFTARTMRIASASLAEPFEWAKFAIERGWACNDTVGCGLVAGWAPSELSERPGFGWYFGGDAMMGSWAMTDYGDFEGARKTLDFLLKKQRFDGKTMHELTQSAALLEWSDYPYGFYHADTTPLFLFSAARYLRQSGDREFLERNWEQLLKAYRFCDTMMDSDGLLSNEKGGAAAVETGALSGKVKRDIYLQGVWLAGLRGFAEIAGWKNERVLAKESRERWRKAAKQIENWFIRDKGYFAFAQLKDATRYEANSGWQGMLLAYGGANAEMSARAAEALARPTLATPWGTRLFATDSPYYNPLGYNDGSVWPFVTAQATMALYEHGQPAAGYRYLRGLANATGLSGAGFISEYFSGDRFAEGPRSVPHQLFSSVAMIHPLVSGMLGLEADAMRSVLRVHPQLPCHAGAVKFEAYRVGKYTVSGEIVPGRPRQTVSVRSNPEGLDIQVDAAACVEMEEPAAFGPGDPAARR